MNPYDADAALEKIRPRLDAARARRRRAVGASTGALLLAVSSVAAAGMLSPSDSTSVVATSPDPLVGVTTTSVPDSLGDDVNRQGDGAGADQAPAPLPLTGVETSSPTTEAPKPPTPPPTDAPKPLEPAEAPKPPTTEAPKPSTTSTTTPTAQQHTFTYPGTGSVTVSQTGSKLTFVSATAEPGWSKHLVYDQHDLIGVEFKKDNIQRWLKIKVIDGVAVAQQHEQIACVAPPGTTTHQAPSGAGSIDVTVDQAGKLSLGGTVASDGWTPEVIENSDSVVKVGFRHTDGQFVWVKVRTHDCALKVETS